MCRTPFNPHRSWPVYDRKELIRNKCIISEMTSNTFADCGRMFFSEFLELSKYAAKRFTAEHYIPDQGEELSNLG